MTETTHSAIQIVRPRETRQILGQWIRATRQRQGLTQPMLASRSGVAVTSLSRLEREGQGGVDNFLRVLQALGTLDGLHAHIQESLRQAMLPRDLSGIAEVVSGRKRVRPRKQPESIP